MNVSLDSPAAESAQLVEAGHTSADIATQQKVLLEVYEAVKAGADAFLMAEYRICFVFLFLFGIVILVLVSHVGSKNGADGQGEFRWSDGGSFARLLLLALPECVAQRTAYAHWCVCGAGRRVVGSVPGANPQASRPSCSSLAAARPSCRVTSA